ncbi:hypothetical protein [Telluribacter sp.]|jgi:hypothetical protein|uniref:hypothetical protein n=1 Tax=Telluribacter sp. TaxID=1978767 RepID=UPI002E0E987E|nr:hypothetical protein [Telluribacter sp.]
MKNCKSNLVVLLLLLTGEVTAEVPDSTIRRVFHLDTRISFSGKAITLPLSCQERRCPRRTLTLRINQQEQPQAGSPKQTFPVTYGLDTSTNPENGSLYVHTCKFPDCWYHSGTS